MKHIFFILKLLCAASTIQVSSCDMLEPDQKDSDGCKVVGYVDGESGVMPVIDGDDVVLKPYIIEDREIYDCNE